MRTENNGRSDEPAVWPCGGNRSHRSHGVRFVGRGTDRGPGAIQNAGQSTERCPGDCVPADVEHHRQGMHQHLWSGRCGLCGGLASAGIHPRHAVVDQLPACELQARLQAGHGSRIQEHGSAVLRGRRGHQRRRGATRDSPPSSIRTASPQQTSTAATRTSPTTPIRRKFRNAA